MENDDLVSKLIEIKFEKQDDFLKIAETLTRIGIPSEVKNELYQSVHILHKKGKYYLLSFKELFMLDGKASSLSEDDIKRRNTIIQLLEDWNLVKVVNPELIKAQIPKSKIKIIPYKDKNNWRLISKYSIGKKSNG